MLDRNSKDMLIMAADQNIKERDYWLAKLSGDLAKTTFPRDFAKDKTGSETLADPGDRVQYLFQTEFFSQLIKLSKGSDYALNVILTAALILLLNKYTGNKDVIVGAPIYKQETEKNFINMVVALRNQLPDHMTFKELLLEVKQTVSEADENQNYPYEVLVDRLKLNISSVPGSGEPSLFDIAVLLENIHDKHYLQHTHPQMIFSFLRTAEHIRLQLEYQSTLYSRSTIDRVIAHYERLVRAVTADVEIRNSEIDILSAEEKKQLLVDFNNTTHEYAKDKTIHQLFESQAEEIPDHIAVVAQSTVNHALTYRELNKKANQLAIHLKEKGVGAETIVGIMLERSLEMIIGILGILKAGGAYLPIDTAYPQDRIDYMLTDSGAKLLITADTFDKTPVNSAFRLRSPTASVAKKQPATYLAYIIYTSGSTGKAKGVMVTHRNVVRLVNNTGYVELTGETRILQTGAPVFDASTFEIWGALLNGGKLYLVDNDVILNADKLGQAIVKNRVNTLWLSSPLFNQLVQQNSDIFTGLEYLLVGGDVLSPPNINRVRNKYNDLKIVNGYGPTENTTFSTTFLIDDDFHRNIPIGSPIDNSTAYILEVDGDAQFQLQPPGVFGELCVGGDGVSRGYLNNPELTAERFILPQRTQSLFHLSPLYRTGDRARWLPHGIVEFSGRKDFQVKIRGYRVEPGEIESCLLNHSKIKDAVVMVKEEKEGGGDKYLCAYIVTDGDLSTAELRTYAGEELPGYMIPSYFVPLEKMPLNPNGKLDRKALPEPQSRRVSTDYVAPRDETEEKLVRIWSEVLGIEENRVGIDDDFLELGGHSLRATKVAYHIHKTFRVNFELKEVFVNPTVRELALRIKAAEPLEYTEIAPMEKKEYYKLSYAQRRLWIICQFEDESTAYNLPNALALHHRFNIPVFEQAFQTLASRHEGLRTVFISAEGEPQQKIIEDFRFKLEQEDLSDVDEGVKEEKAKNLFMTFFEKPFDLEKGPLFRVKTVRLSDEMVLLFFVIHHLVTDGWSQGTLTNEFVTLYNSYLNSSENPLPPLKLQYKDYTRWHNILVDGPSLSQSEGYWLEKFKDKPNGIELPLDHPRKSRQTFNGRSIPFTISKEAALKLRDLNREEDTTLFMILLAIFDVFLYKYTGQEDIIVGSPIAGRKQAELHDMVGFLVNTLVYRTLLQPGKSFRDLLQDVKEETLACYDHQDYPFNLLVDRLELDRDLSQSPLFNVMLAHNNTETEDNAPAMAGVNATDYTYQNEFNLSVFDLTLFVVEAGDELSGSLMYNTDLFEAGVVNRMINNFLNLLARVTEKPGEPISWLTIMEDSEYERILKTFNAGHGGYPFPALTLQELFERQVEASRDKTAVVNHNASITYNELNKKVNRLAHYLIDEYRVKPNAIIAVSMDRSIDMIIVLWGIIKAGAAYLAVDPTYPRDRVLHVLADSRSDLLIIDEMRPDLFGGYGGDILNVCSQWNKIDEKSGHKTANPVVMNKPTDILYVNYTSGSTGTPNGAMLSHDCLTNLIQWQNEHTLIDGSMSCLQFTSINFCVSFQEIMGTLTAGGKLHLIGDIQRQDIDYLMDFLIKYQIELLFLPFSYLNFLFNESGRWHQTFRYNLKHIITAGEQLKVTAGLKRFLDLNPELKLHNHYGSTEMHVVTSYTLDASTADKTPIPPAGKPISNVDIYILDEDLNPVPLWVWGELFVKGETEVLGYINNDELTNKKLVYHPAFSQDNQRLYRSGDIGRWREDGNIELRGRGDFLVKVRGFRIEPGEIESKILSIPRVRECVVVVREDETGEKILLAYVSVDNIDAAEIKKIIGNDLPQYMIPRIIVLKNLPLMHNGKVDREKLPEPEPGTGEDYIPPASEVEEALADIWAQLLAMDKERIGRQANFFELGGHSLKATLMVSGIYKKFSVKVPLVTIFQTATLEELAAVISGAEKDTGVDIPGAEAKDYYPLSFNQQRLYILHNLQPLSPAFNMSGHIELRHEVDKTRVEQALNRVTERHESFRTAFKTVDDLPCQQVVKGVDLSLETIDISLAEPGKKQREAERVYKKISTEPFDLTRAPLFRSTLLKLEPQLYWLLFSMHHIISDGWSLQILKQEFTRLYEDYRAGKKPGLELLAVQYKDFSQWHNRQLTGKGGEESRRFWKKKVAAGVPVLQLPADSEIEKEDREGGGYRCMIQNDIKTGLKKLAETHHTTLFTVMFSIYLLFLSRISGQGDIGCSIIAAGRDHPSLENIIGFFVNSLIFSIHVDEDEPAQQFLQGVHRGVIETFQHQSYPLEPLFEELDMRYPDIPVSFNMLNLGDAQLAESLEPFEPEHMEHTQDIKFDLEPYISEYRDGIEMYWAYKKKMFEPATIQYMINLYIKMLAFFAKDPGQSLKSYRSEERKQRSGKRKRFKKE